MKICFIDWFAYGLFNPKSKIVFGGAQIQLYFLSKELAKDKKYTVSFLTDNQKNNKVQTFSNVKVYQFVRSPKTPGVFGRLLNLLYRIPALGYTHFFWRLLVQLGKINADIYVQRAASAETGLIALICKILRRRFIFMVAHEQDVNDTFIRQNGWRGKLFFLGLRMADKIVCQTMEQHNFLPEALRRKSVVVKSGYPLDPIKRPRRKKAGCLWVARAERWKNPELFIKLAQNIPGEKFTMICPRAENDPDYFAAVRTKAQKIKNLIFIPSVTFEKIDRYFAGAKVFISTSVSEGFPNTFIQAAKNMTPTVSLAVNPDGVITRNKIGFCAYGDEKRLAKQLSQILKNDAYRQQLGENAYNYARQHHNIKQTVATLVIKSLNEKTVG